MDSQDPPPDKLPFWTMAKESSAAAILIVAVVGLAHHFGYLETATDVWRAMHFIKQTLSAIGCTVIIVTGLPIAYAWSKTGRSNKFGWEPRLRANARSWALGAGIVASSIALSFIT